VIRPLLPTLGIALLSVLAGCTETPSLPPEEPLATVSDGLGRTVVINRAPQRVVSIAPGATHIVRAAGSLERLVAVTTSDYKTDDLTHLPRVSALPLDLEAIVAFNPDLVLASDQVNDQSHASMFEALDIPIIYLGSDTWDDIRASILMTGTILGSTEYARATTDALQAQRDELVSLTNSIEEAPTAIFLVSSTRSYSFGRGSYVLDLMRWAGLDPLTEVFDTPAPVLDDEWVLLNNPDVIVGTFSGSDVINELLSNHPTWQSLDAIRSGRIVDVPASLILTPGPNNIRAAWLMARAVHPEHLRSAVDGSE
jgi:iron complex transport system substrate-binding protein